ncbi:MAG: 8-oxoguanine DNA glycosylase [Lachnospiraceae bacterium]|nr:8-oxoguanine DNA glycosylase [Lachnospiraceae bacterium]
MTIQNIKTGSLSLAQICDSGQCFRMKKLNNGHFEIIARDRRVEVWHQDSENSGRICFACEEQEYSDFWRGYFDIDTDTDYDMIRSMVDPEDVYLTAAVREGSGIRILRQDLWEMIVTFLISQQNNIPRIHKCIDNICMKYGEKVIAEGGGVYYAFPTPESMAGLNEDDLMPCNLGYRSKYVVRTAQSVAGGDIDLNEIRKMNYEDARNALLQIYGVGAKVADCICLFGLHHLDAFPVDTHIKQVLEREYALHVAGSDAGTDTAAEKKASGRKGGSRKKKSMDIRSLSTFPFDRYSGYAGVMQQYIFYRELSDR